MEWGGGARAVGCMGGVKVDGAMEWGGGVDRPRGIEVCVEGHVLYPQGLAWG